MTPEEVMKARRQLAEARVWLPLVKETWSRVGNLLERITASLETALDAIENYHDAMTGLVDEIVARNDS
jgi:hypothetical protein